MRITISNQSLVIKSANTLKDCNKFCHGSYEMGSPSIKFVSIQFKNLENIVYIFDPVITIIPL